jgi:RNA polymerase sigma-70 factor (ECF subfamily)
MRTEDEAARWGRLTELLAPFHDAASRTARRLCRSPDEGDDLFQEAVLRAFEKLPALRDEKRFRSWFYAVLLSMHRSRSRRQFWRRFVSFDGGFAEGEGPAGEDGATWEEERLRAERASRALATLPAVQREAVVLFEVDGWSIEEVAATQKVSISAVKSRLARGRTRLRRHYERLGFGGVATRATRAPAGLTRKEVCDER